MLCKRKSPFAARPTPACPKGADWTPRDATFREGATYTKRSPLAAREVSDALHSPVHPSRLAGVLPLSSRGARGLHGDKMLRLADLREMLRYVPEYRDRVFVIATDGAIVEHENFRNLLLDIALLRSLRIHVALVHGAGHQVRKLAEQTGQKPSNIDGMGITDAPTLQLALNAATRVTHEILEGLSATDLRGASTNAVIAHPAGILQGVDHLFTGKVERVDTVFLRNLLEHDVIPVIPPLGCDGEGSTFRLNSDAVAVDVARALEAV